jgi:hypothetical protein
MAHAFLAQVALHRGLETSHPRLADEEQRLPGAMFVALNGKPACRLDGLVRDGCVLHLCGKVSRPVLQS